MEFKINLDNIVNEVKNGKRFVLLNGTPGSYFKSPMWLNGTSWEMKSWERRSNQMTFEEVEKYFDEKKFFAPGYVVSETDSLMDISVFDEDGCVSIDALDKVHIYREDVHNLIQSAKTYVELSPSARDKNKRMRGDVGLRGIFRCSEDFRWDDSRWMANVNPGDHKGSEFYISGTHNHAVSLSGMKLTSYEFKGQIFQCDFGVNIVPSDVLSQSLDILNKNKSGNDFLKNKKNAPTSSPVPTASDGTPLNERIKEVYDRMFNDTEPLYHMVGGGKDDKVLVKNYRNYRDKARAIYEGSWYGDEWEEVDEDGVLVTRDNVSDKSFSGRDLPIFQFINRFTNNDYELTYEFYKTMPYYLNMPRDKQKSRDSITRSKIKSTLSKSHNYYVHRDFQAAREVGNVGKSEINDFDIRNDVNVTNDITTERAKAQVIANKEEDFMRSISSSLVADKFFEDIDKGLYEKRVPTGLPLLDEFILEGGLTNGLAILGGESSIGKTTLMLQIAVHCAKNGRDVLFFSCEMSSQELITKILIMIISEHNLLKGKTNDSFKTTFKTIQSRTDDEHKSIIQDARKTFKETIAPHLFIVEPDHKMKEQEVENATRLFMKMRPQEEPPVVFIDYLQILEPYQSDDPSMRVNISEATGIGDNVSRLRTFFGREVNTTCFLISAFNRTSNQLADGELPGYDIFKGSSGIEYGADFLFVLMYQKVNDEEIEKNRNNRKERKIVLFVMKNRNGVRERLNIKFYPSSQRFEIDPNERQRLENKNDGKDDDINQAMEKYSSSENFSPLTSLKGIREKYYNVKKSTPNEPGVKISNMSPSKKIREIIKDVIIGLPEPKEFFFNKSMTIIYDKTDYETFTKTSVNAIDEDALKRQVEDFLNLNERTPGSKIGVEEFSRYLGKTLKDTLVYLKKSKTAVLSRDEDFFELKN